MRTKPLIFASVIGIVVIIMTFGQQVVQAAPTGWLWGGTSSTNGAYQGIGWLDISGVTIPSGNGTLSGYAWSENYGWLSFNQSDLAGCPSGTCAATKSGSGITGWARFLALENTPGMDGWVSLSGSGYGIGTGNAYFWSSDLGWIDASALALPTVHIQFN